MENLIFSLNVVLPVVLVCLLGFFLKSIWQIGTGFEEIASKIIYNIAIPCSMFSSITSYSIRELFNFNLLVFVLVAILINAGVLMLIVPRFVKDRAKSASVIQGIFRSNFIMLGIALAENMFGKEGAFPSMLIIPFAISLFSVLSVFIFSYLIPEHGGGKGGIASTTLKLAKNPLIISAVLSMFFAFFEIKLPAFASNTVSNLGRMANPLALIMLGAQFELKSVKDNLKYTMTASLCKLIVVPAVFLTPAVLMGYRGPELGALLILFSTPTAVTSYIMAKQLGGDEDIAGQIVCLSTVLSAFTVVLWIYILKSMGLI